MILSVSRRTDIPAFYSDWFINRLREGCVMVRNPMNYHSISKIELSPSVVDCIVFWTKNPQPLMKYLSEIDKNYMYYFQYTLNAYDKDIEPTLPCLDERLSAFKNLSTLIGKKRVIWRYDPILKSKSCDITWHIKNFEHIAKELQGFTETCVFSFVDIYEKNINNFKRQGASIISPDEMDIIACEFSKIAKENNIILKTCCENINFSEYGIMHSCCIDPVLMGSLLDCKLVAKKDNSQRPSCGCIESIDIGQYNTCKHGCIYCYANYSQQAVAKNCLKHDIASPLLLGGVELEDKVSIRKVTSLKDLQLSFWDNDDK